MADFAFRRLCAVFDLGEQRRLDPNAPVSDLFGVWLRFAVQWLQPRLQVLRRGGIEAVVDLAGINKILAPLPADVETVEAVVLEGEASDRQRFRLRTGDFEPVVRPTVRIATVPDLRDHAL
jgi:hypothetical protein